MYNLADHLMHAVLLAVLVFLVLRYIAGLSNTKSVNHAVLVGFIAMVYMLVVGHGLPKFLNLGVNF